MIAWEYLILTVFGQSTKQLDARGKEGWELVAVRGDRKPDLYFMKRPTGQPLSVKYVLKDGVK